MPASTTTTISPNVAAQSTIPNGSAALPFTAASSTTTKMANGSSSLPYTGGDVAPLAYLGSLLILIGGLLLLSVESRRRALARATVVRLDKVKEGARKTGYWFFGS